MFACLLVCTILVLSSSLFKSSSYKLYKYENSDTLKRNELHLMIYSWLQNQALYTRKNPRQNKASGAVLYCKVFHYKRHCQQIAVWGSRWGALLIPQHDEKCRLLHLNFAIMGQLTGGWLRRGLYRTCYYTERSEKCRDVSELITQQNENCMWYIHVYNLQST